MNRTKRLSAFDTALYALAVGTGLRWIAVAAAVGPSSLPLWLLALVTFYFPLAAATAALTARFDGEGGIYAWARDGLGPLCGFLCGWFYWISLMPFFGTILVFLSALILSSFGADAKDPALSLAVSAGLALFVTGVQLAGLRYGKWLPNSGTAGGWIVVAVIVAMALVLAARGQSATDFVHASYAAPLNFDTAILWGTILFAYSGAESLAFLRSDIDGGMTSIVRALIIVGIGSLIIYLGGTAAFLTVLPKEALTRLSGFPDALRLGLIHAGAGGFAPLVIGLFALSMLGSFTAWFGVGAQLPFAAGIDNFLPKIFAKRHPRTGAPAAAILLQGGLTLALVLLSQLSSTVASAYDVLVAMSILTVAIPYLFMFAAFLVCVRLPPVPGAWMPPGGTLGAVLLGWTGMLSTLIAIACTLVPSNTDPNPLATFYKIVLSALGALIAGLVLYWLGSRGKANIAA